MFWRKVLSFLINKLAFMMMLCFSISSVNAGSELGKRNYCSELLAKEDPYNEKVRDRVSLEFNGCWYGGLGLGVTSLRPVQGSDGWGARSTGSSGLSLSFGRQLAPEWFVEGFYSDLGASVLVNDSVQLSAQSPDAEIGYSVLGVYGGYYVRKLRFFNFTPFVRTGIASISANVSGLNDGVAVGNTSSSQSLIGMGVDWRARYSPWMLRVGYDRYADNINVMGGTVIFYIDGKR